jgi:hypothetical protein
MTTEKKWKESDVISSSSDFMSPHSLISDTRSKSWVHAIRVVKDGVVVILTPMTQEVLKQMICV